MTDSPRSAKADRRRRALEAEKERVSQHLMALSNAMMRADAALEAYKRERGPIIASGISDAELIAQAERQLLRVENNEYTRSIALLTTWFALLYVVIEGWRKWKFNDPKVDSLLTSEHAGELKDYRHAVFHAEGLDAPGLLQFRHSADRSTWVSAISNQLRDALKDWNAHFPERFAEYAARLSLSNEEL
jgi:hypothetical protein